MLKLLFKLIHYKHFRNKSITGKPYIKSIVKIKAWDMAIVDYYDGQRAIVIF